MILIVAGATCREAVRSRAFLGLLAIFAVAALLTAAAPAPRGRRRSGMVRAATTGAAIMGLT